MNIQNQILLEELVKQSEIKLPQSILKKYIKLTAVTYLAIKNSDYFVQYDQSNNILELIYIVKNAFYEDYWLNLAVGELVFGDLTHTKKLFDYLVKSDLPYFLIATSHHQYIEHYPIKTESEISECNENTSITGIFVPCESFIRNCHGDTDLMIERLEIYCRDYTACCNGNVYSICKDTYSIEQESEKLIWLKKTSQNNFIGYEDAKFNLTEFY